MIFSGKIIKKIILVVCLFELVIIFVLAINIYNNKDNVLGTNVNIDTISKDDVIFSKEDLKYFYERKPNSTDNKKPEWLPKGYDYTITINADSLNERFDYSSDKPQDVFRIITLGDSFTYGAYVNTKDNYPEQLEDLLNNSMSCSNIKKFEVINLGVGGYDIEYSVNFFKIRGQKYNPDLVLWNLKDDDFFLINEFILPKIQQYRKEISANQSMLEDFYDKGSFSPWVDKAVEDLVSKNNEEEVIDYSKKAIEKISDQFKGKLVILSFSGTGALNNSYFNILQEFVQGRRDTYFYDGLNSNYDQFADGHPNQKGYEEIANEIFNYIKSNNLIPCN